MKTFALESFISPLFSPVGLMLFGFPFPAFLRAFSFLHASWRVLLLTLGVQ